MSSDEGMRVEVVLPEEAIEQIAQRAAEIVASRQPPPREEKEFLTAREAAEMIPCSVKKVYHLVGARRIPFQRVGRQLSFKRSETEEWKAKGGASTPA